MMKLAEEKSAKLHFNEKCVAADFEHTTVSFENTISGKKQTTFFVLILPHMGGGGL